MVLIPYPSGHVSIGDTHEFPIKTAQVYYFQFWRFRSPKSASLESNQGVGKASWKNELPCFFQLLAADQIPWLVALYPSYCFFCHVALSNCDPPDTLFEGPLWWPWAPQTIQDGLPISRSGTHTHSQVFFSFFSLFLQKCSLAGISENSASSGGSGLPGSEL